MDTSHLAATVIFDDTKTNVNQMKQTLASSGYTVTDVIYENARPVADAGSDQTVKAGDPVTLDGSESYDPDDGIQSYQWKQQSGISVALSDPTAVQPVFTAPDVPAEGASLNFLLTVADKSGETSTDTCIVNVQYESNVTRLSPDEAKQMIDTVPDLMIVDVREPNEFCGEYGHIPDSVNYPWNSGILEEKYSELPKHADILVICRTGNRSEEAAQFLDGKGFTSVYDIGGMNTWEWEVLTCSEEPPVLSVELNADETVSLNWTAYTGMYFESYAVLRNSSPDPEYPGHSIWQEEDPAITGYDDDEPLAGPSYYRIGVIKSSGEHLYSESVRITVKVPMELSLSADKTRGETPLSVSFTTTLTGGVEPHVYSWNFGDGKTAGNAGTQTHTYTAAGSYTAAVTVTDAGGGTVSQSAEIIVTKENQPPVADAGAYQTADEGAGVMLNAGDSYDPEGGALQYLWEQTGGTPIILSDAAIAQPQFAAPEVGTQGESLTFRLTVTDDEGLHSQDSCTVFVSAVNDPPVADAGEDQTADEGASITLNAADSYDPEGNALQYLWEQTGGTPIILSDTAIAQPQFVAPEVGTQGESLTFRLTVTDDAGLQSEDTCMVFVNPVNEPPVADAGADQTADEGTEITLNASGSSDPNGDALQYFWEQIAGTRVTLSDTAIAQPQFAAPDVGAESESLTFRVTVTDDAGLQSEDTCTVFVNPVNQPPVANAGTDQTVEEGNEVSLSASDSYDPDGNILQYFWEQTGGTRVTLSDTATAQPAFVAPDVGAEGKSLIFRVTVRDDAGSESSDTCSVYVKGMVNPPVADAGADQTVDEGTEVSLNGFDSYDPNSGFLEYLWEQIDGTAVSLSDTAIPQPSFVAPDTGTEGESLTFRLTVTNEAGLQSQDTCVIDVNNVNHAPVANAGADQTVNAGAEVMLDGSDSYDPDGSALQYFWEQTGGISVILSDTGISQPTFAAPDAGTESLTFRLTVSNDAGLKSQDTCSVFVKAANHPPVADAGEDQTVNEGSAVTLNASDSYDPDGPALQYLWEQTGGTRVTLSDPAIGQPMFIAPDADGEALIFRLTVTDDAGVQSQDTCSVFVNPAANHPPMADAGDDQTADEGDGVVLDGSDSYDPEGGILEYFWEQTGGTSVTLSDSSAGQPQFTAPDLGTDLQESLTFRLTVTDEAGLQSQDTCTVAVNSIDNPPAADAGADQTVDEGDDVTLDGSGSYDSEGGLEYLWTQIGGTPVTLSDNSAEHPKFTAPNIETDSESLTFRLTVTDSAGAESQDTCVIRVENKRSSGGSGGCFIDTANYGFMVKFPILNFALLVLLVLLVSIRKGRCM